MVRIGIESDTIIRNHQGILVYRLGRNGQRLHQAVHGDGLVPGRRHLPTGANELPFAIGNGNLDLVIICRVLPLPLILLPLP